MAHTSCARDLPRGPILGHDHFLPLQEQIIASVLDGNDNLTLMQTREGKSLYYQLPSLRPDGLTLVVSPLISLITNRVNALQANGIAAAFIDSAIPHNEMRRLQMEGMAGRIRIRYVAPERLALDSFQAFLDQLNVSFMVGGAVALDHLMPPPNRVAKTRSAVETPGTFMLSPTRDLLDEQSSYEELGLVRLQLRQQGRDPTGAHHQIGVGSS